MDVHNVYPNAALPLIPAQKHNIGTFLASRRAVQNLPEFEGNIKETTSKFSTWQILKSAYIKLSYSQSFLLFISTKCHRNLHRSYNTCFSGSKYIHKMFLFLQSKMSNLASVKTTLACRLKPAFKCPRVNVLRNENQKMFTCTTHIQCRYKKFQIQTSGMM
jgi:hypothetical protein